MINFENDLKTDVTEEDYIIEKKRFVKICQEAEINEESVAFFGDGKDLSISDIDAVIISSPGKIKTFKILFRNEKIKSKKFNYLFWHEPIYILNDFINNSIYLHSLENITPISQDNVYKKIINIKNNDKDILYFYWFCFLINNYCNLKNSINKNKTISLRLILLLHKNIEYSNNYFSDGNNDFVDSKNLRNYVLANTNNLNYDKLWKSFEEVFIHTCINFDIFCKKKLNQYSSNSTKKFIVFGKLIYRLSDYTQFRNGALLNNMFLNNIAFNLISEYFYGNKTFSKIPYITNSNILKQIYKKNNLPFSFISPIPTSENFFKNIIIFSFNKTLNFLIKK